MLSDRPPMSIKPYLIPSAWPDVEKEAVEASEKYIRIDGSNAAGQFDDGGNRD